MSNKALVNPTVNVNNQAVFIIANSCTYNEGKGEQTVTTQVSGSNVETVFSDNAETKMSKVAFELSNTPANIETARLWKSLENNNGIIIQDDSGFTRTFTNMTLTNDYEVNLGTGGNIPLEFMGDPAS